MSYKSDIEIAREANKNPIQEIGAKLGIEAADLVPYGHDKAKVSQSFINSVQDRADGKLILVTAINPTPAGEGKTTTTVGLGDGLNRIGKKAMVCIREASLGPNFGMKGGAAGGGYAQIVPMEEMNLHFTGDFHAITSAHSLLSAMIDNHIYWGNEAEIDIRRVQWKRVVDMNDRALRQITASLGGVANGFPRETGFDITVASEVMAILCLARDLEDLEKRLGDMIVAYRRDRSPIYCRDLKADGAMAVLLKDAMQPNLVQTLENNPAFVHGGPFANIAHGCNSVIATQTALKLADYVVTEAGFGVGGSYGRGGLRIGQQTVDYYSAISGTFGLQIGAQQYSHALFFMTPEALSDFRNTGGWAAGADLRYAGNTDAANLGIDTTQLLDPVIAVVFGQAGLIAGATLDGTRYQRILP